MNEILLWLLLGGIASGLVWLARLHPLVSLAMGLVLGAVPVLQWLTFDAKYFRSDGSVGGLVLFVIYALFGVFCGVMGLTFTAAGVVGIFAGDRAWRPKLSLRQAVSVVLAGALLGAGLFGYLWKGRAWLADREMARYQREQIADKAVRVTERYALSWRRDIVSPELRLVVPVADLRREWLSRVAQVSESPNGPRRLELVVANPEAAGARLKLYRDDNAIRADIGGTRSQDGGSFWVEGRGGAWTFRGDNAPGELAQRFPWAFGVGRVALRTTEVPRNGRASCLMVFSYAERPAILEADVACAGEPAVRALAAAIELLGRLARDTDTPPSPQTRLARARTAAQHCAAAETQEARALLCDYAIQASGAELQASGAQAGDLLVSAMANVMTVRGMPPAMAGSGWLEHGFDILGGGRGEDRAAMLAHFMNLAAIWNAKDPARKDAFDRSLDAFTPLAAKLAAADDPLFELLDRVVGGALLDSDARKARHVELTRSWDEKARATHPGTELAARARFRHCRARLHLKSEHAALKDCADDLFASWESRAAGAQGFAPFYDEGVLVVAVMHLYTAHAHAVGDLASGLASVKRVEALAAKRFAANERIFEYLRWSQEGLEKELKRRGG